jgi:hypothetical protein
MGTRRMKGRGDADQASWVRWRGDVRSEEGGGAFSGSGRRSEISSTSPGRGETECSCVITEAVFLDRRRWTEGCWRENRRTDADWSRWLMVEDRKTQSRDIEGVVGG